MAGCTEVATTVDHIVSRMDNGSDALDNLQAACSSCNQRKGASPSFFSSDGLQNAGDHFLPPFLPVTGHMTAEEE